MTGYYRDGYCHTNKDDMGKHTVCASITQEFLDYSKQMGNDLSTPNEPMFPGLKEGDKWCVCVLRWRQAYEAGMAPYVYLESTDEQSLEFVEFDWLVEYSVERQQKFE